MAVEFNHTIVWARDSGASAKFLAEILGLPAPKKWGPFVVVTTDNRTNVDFMDADGEIKSQHYAFLVSEAEFDGIFGRIRERGLSYWADPAQAQPGQINHNDGGRGVFLEILTRRLAYATLSLMVFLRPMGSDEASLLSHHSA